MKGLFIINPVAGKGRGKKTAKHIERFMKEKAMSYDIRFTRCKGDGEVIAKDAIQKGYTKIIAAGGDGTIYETANGMVGSHGVLGIIPCGTGNDLAKSLGISENIEKALNIIFEGYERSIDCGRANGRLFLNVASVGFDAEIVKETEMIKKYIKGPSAYVMGVFKTLLHFHDKEVWIDIDGVEMKKNIMLIAVANGRCYGGGMKIAPEARIDDGYFDICIVNKISKGKLLRLFPTIFSGKHLLVDEVELLRGKSIKIESREKLILNMDGDIGGETPVCVEMLKNGIRVMAARENILEDVIAFASK